jgi:hypothetical protein
MNRFSLHLLTYKLAVLAVGGLSLFWGYRLFEKGIPAPSQAASLKAAHGQSRLELENAAPGIFFALFGAAIVVSAVFKGMTLRAKTSEFEAAETEDMRGSGPLGGPVTEAGSLFIGSDLKEIIVYKLEKVAEHVEEIAITESDRYFLQRNVAEIFHDLKLASKGELMIEKQPDIRTPTEVPRREENIETFGSAPKRS